MKRQRFARTVKDRWGESSNAGYGDEVGISNLIPVLWSLIPDPAQMVPSDRMFLIGSPEGRGSGSTTADVAKRERRCGMQKAAAAFRGNEG